MSFKQRITKQILRTKMGAKWIGRLMALLQKCWSSTEVDISTRLSPALEVLGGPFLGVRYQSVEQVPLSKILPKLLGSYEEELHEIIESLRRIPYRSIVNIGCAEGYYTTGLARMLPQAMVYAFDLNPQSLEHAHKMAQLNGVVKNIEFHGLFDRDTFTKIRADEPVFVICDCEGAEYELITPEVMRGIKFDALIELHNYRAREGKALLLATLFEKTHEAVWIMGRKRNEVDYPELERFASGERFRILDEGRPCLMDWLWLTRKPD